MRQRRMYGSMSGRKEIIKETNGSAGSTDSDSDLLIDNIDDDDDDDEEDLLNCMGPDINDSNAKILSNDEKRSVSKIDHTDDEF